MGTNSEAHTTTQMQLTDLFQRPVFNNTQAGERTEKTKGICCAAKNCFVVEKLREGADNFLHLKCACSVSSANLLYVSSLSNTCHPEDAEPIVDWLLYNYYVCFIGPVIKTSTDLPDIHVATGHRHFVNYTFLTLLYGIPMFL